MAKIPSLTSDFKIVFFPIKKEMEGSSRNTEANLVTLGSTQSSPERWNESSRGSDRSTPSGSSTLTETSIRGNV